jgi:tetratricopeptide (TPR) repeat protein
MTALSIVAVLLASLAWRAVAASFLEADPATSPASVGSAALPDPVLGQFAGELNPLEQALFEDAADGQFDRHTLLRAALVASGVADPAEIERYEAQAALWHDQIERLGVMRGAEARQAEELFDFIHLQILRGGYAIECSELTWVLNQGQFNCVSGTVLFNSLAESFGLQTVGLELPGHVMSRLLGEGGAIDIETTCPRWFRLMDRPDERARLVEKTLGFEPPSEAVRRECREVTPVQLAAMIYYNRGVDLLAAKQFPEALAANAKALRLDPLSSTARGNLLATLNNWAIALGMGRKYPEAVALLNQGLDLDPNYETFRINYLHVHHQWIEELCAGGRFADALIVQQQALDRLPSDGYLRQAGHSIIARRDQAQQPTVKGQP